MQAMDEIALKISFVKLYIPLDAEEATDGQSHSEETSGGTEPNTASQKETQGSTCGSSHKRSRHLLNKEERKRVVESLQAVSGGALLLNAVIKHLAEQLHMQHYPEREELLVSLLDSSEEEMERICAGLASMFIELYTKCDSGKEKYGRFQVEWHKSCAKFLLDTTETYDSESDLCSLPPPSLWLFLTKSIYTQGCS